nr:odorant receptor 49b-like [Onthophagus taurus]
MYEDILAVSEVLYVMISLTSYAFKLFAMFTKKTLIYSLENDIESNIFNPNSKTHDEILEENVLFIKKLVKMYQFSAVSSAGLFGIFPLLANKSLPIRFSYNIGNFKPIMFALQVIGLGVCAWSNISLDLLCTTLMVVSAVQFDSLKHRLVHGPTKNSSIQQREDDLRYCIQHHLAIINYTKKVDKLFSFAILTIFLGGMVESCNSIFQVFILLETTFSAMQFVQLITYFLVMYVEMVLYCWFGNEIIIKSLTIMDACYETEWYSYSQKSKKSLIFIMERAKYPLYINVSKFTVASLVTLVAITRWSYSAFTLLRRVYGTH